MQVGGTLRARAVVAARKVVGAIACLSLAINGAVAQTWVGTTSTFETAGNWSPATVPDVGSTATFAGSGVTTVSIAADRQRFDWRIRRAVQLMRTAPHLAHDINTLAHEAGLSRAHFYRQFERSTRMTPHVYLNVLRMELAVNSVVHADDSLGAVSDRGRRQPRVSPGPRAGAARRRDRAG